MRRSFIFVLAVMLAPTSPALAGSSAQEIRKTIVGKSCAMPGYTFHFGRNGNFAYTFGRRRIVGTYNVGDGLISISFPRGAWHPGMDGTHHLNAVVSGNKLYLPLDAFYGSSYGYGGIVRECR